MGNSTGPIPFDPSSPKRGKKVIPEGKRSSGSLLPNSPVQKTLIHNFKKIIASHLQEVEGKTTEDFLEDLSSELWKATR